MFTDFKLSICFPHFPARIGTLSCSSSELGDFIMVNAILHSKLVPFLLFISVILILGLITINKT